MDDYIDSLEADREQAAAFYRASRLREKPEQQKRLEALLAALPVAPGSVADIACGDGTTTRHLADVCPRAAFTLVDRFETALGFAREATKHLSASCLIGDIHALPLRSDSYDVVVCWQTLSWLTKPDAAVRELVRICRPGGRVYASSLFNADVDVDVYASVVDHHRRSASQGWSVAYNTYSMRSVHDWTAGLVAEVRLHDFEIPIDLKYSGRGLGTRTVTLEGGKRLQISGGMLLNWGILELRK